MSSAIDEADVVLVAVSREYRDSANCRLEAEYAHTQGKRIVFMMMQEDFTKPTGWLGMLVGAKLWHPLFGASSAKGKGKGKGDDMATKTKQLVAALC